jgi:predicted esterase
MRIITASILLLVAGAAHAGELRTDQVFDRYAPLAAADEFSRRIFSPTTYDRLQRFQEYTRVRAAAHTVDLKQERFDLFIPKNRPSRGYGLIVFVSPIERWPLTYDWKKVLDETGIIYVSALHAGNDQNVYKRRIPLALHALENVKARYPVDPERVMISGFSGGSRTAIRIAAGYPDLFTGALLIGGAKVMGEEDFAPPPAELMQRLQRSMRVVYSTGRHDMPNQRLDRRSIDALKTRCVAGVFKFSERNISHEVPNYKTMKRVLRRLETPLDDSALAAQSQCAADLLARVEADVAAAENAYRQGDTLHAGELLGAADLAWGGLAAERMIALARLIAPGFNPAPGTAAGDAEKSTAAAR